MVSPEPPQDWKSVRSALSGRVLEIRRELYGEHGGPLLAAELELPFPLWADYEQGGPMPGEVMLRFLMLTRVDPHWLLTGEGPKYLSRGEDEGPGPAP